MAISLPAFLLGGNLFLGLGFSRGLVAVAIGCAVLTTLALLTMAIGASSRLTTYAIIQKVFGTIGGRLVTLLLSITVFGWYGITATLFGDICVTAVSQTFDVELDRRVFIVIGSGLMVLTAIYGFRALDIISRWTVPLMFLVLATSAYVILGESGFGAVLQPATSESPGLLSIGSAASIVVGSLMVAVTIAPDLARFSRSVRASKIAAVLSYGVGVGLVFVLAGLPALATGSNDLIENMTRSNLGVIALLILILATWTTNATNLYSASLGMKQWFSRAEDWCVTLAAGVLGTLLALGGILDHFLDFLLFLSLAIPPVAGIYITDYYVSRDQSVFTESESENDVSWRMSAFAAWFFGVGLAAIINFGSDVSFTSVPACDATIISALSYWAIHHFMQSD